MTLLQLLCQGDNYPARREIVARLLVSLLAVATSLLALLAPSTFTYQMLIEGGNLAIGGVFVVGALGALLFADTLINDMLPPRFHFTWGRVRRQDMWMALGLLFMVFAFLDLTAKLSISLGTYLVIFASGAFLLAFVDAASEKMDKRCVT